MTPVGISDTEARALIADAVNETLVVEAAAGTGKTTELVNRILRVIESGCAEVREIVAVTFTEKAAGELKLRLRQQLEDRRRLATGTAAVRLQDAVQHLEEAHVSTIHGFCADLLRERPVEARIDPLFRVLTEAQAGRLFDEAFEHWFRQQLEEPPEGVRRSLRRPGRSLRPGEPDEDGPVERLRRAGFELTQWRDFQGPWTRAPFDRDSALARLTVLVHTLADLSADPSYAGDNLYVDTAPVRRVSRDLRSRGDASDSDGLEALFVELRRNRDFARARKGSGAGYRKGVTRAEVLAARTTLIEALDDFRVRADESLAALLHGELLHCVQRYEALKARDGALDFLDLLLRARDLVRDCREVRRHFQDRFKRIFVDEFQDTDPLQAELLLLLASVDPEETVWDRVRPVPGKLFIVGDPKQSIYKFRRADVGVYERVRQLLIGAGAIPLELHRSFRAVPALQRVVNAAFAPVMDGDGEALQARYMPLEPVRVDHPHQPALVALPVPRPYSTRRITDREIANSLPDAVGAFVDWLVHQSGWTVTERRDPQRRVPIEARHVCILFRRFVSYGEDVTRPYVDALEARGMAHLLVGGRTFHGREEIETLRAALMAIEWPEDQLSVFATLRGSLFAIGDAELFEYHQLAGRFSPFRVPDALPDSLQPIGEALTLLVQLHRRRNRRPVADTISELLERTRAHVGFVLRPAGEQVLANVLHVGELARQYEIEGGMSFRGFVDMLQAEAEGGHAAEAPVLEEGSDGVRLMTVHKAKGLEFPVVVLADITARLTPWEAGRHIDSARRLCALRIGGWSPKDLTDNRELELRRERREGERVAYVAATRARDLLVVPAVGDEEYGDGWISPLNRAIYPSEAERRNARAAAACPEFRSRDTVLNRPDGDPATSRTVCPGLHHFGEGEGAYDVVWWSPEPDVLQLGAPTPFGLRRDDLIVKEVAPEVVATRQRAYRDWAAGRAAVIGNASRPSLMIRTVTEAVAGDVTAGAEIDLQTVIVPAIAGRPSGVRFGTLVHALLGDVPLGLPDANALTSLGEAHGRVLGAGAAEVAAAVQTVQQVLAHPLMRDAADAAQRGHCWREAPVTLRRGDLLIEGAVDLAFDSGTSITVIDFKTDRELAGVQERYSRQVRVYAAAIAEAVGRPVRAVLMQI